MSNLLDKASILLTPTAYDNGHMNAIKPYENLYGLEQGDDSVISNSGDAVMTKTSSLNYNATSGGTQTSSVRPRLLFNNVTVGKKYRITIKATNRSGNIIFKLYDGSSYIINNNDLSSDINFTFTAQSSTTVNFNFDGTEVFNVDLEISLKEDLTGDFDFSRGSAATRVNTQGLVEEITDINLPRIDYTDGCGSWLLEPQSTNYSVNSEQPSTWHSSDGATITANAATSPEGLQNSSLVVTNASSGERYTRNNFGFSSGSGLQTVTTSYFIKYYNNQWVRLRSIFFNGSPANNVSTFFDVQNGVLGTVDANHTAKIEDYGNGWYRCSITFDIDKSVDSNGYVHIEAMDGDNSNAFAAIGQGYYAYGSQGEEFSYPTSYIPSGAAFATRLQDLANNSGNSSLINSTEGVLYFEAKTDNSNVGSISINDGTLSNRITARFRIDLNKIQLTLSGSTDDFNLNSDTITLSDYNKIAIVYNNGDYYFFINGVKSSVQSDRGTFSANTFTQLDFNRGGGGEVFFGETKAVAVYKEALTDAELQSLTTI